MNIKMINSEVANSLLHRSITRKPNNTTGISLGKFTGLETPEKNVGLSVSISKESKALLRQSNYEKKQQELDVLSETKKSTENSSNPMTKSTESVNYVLLDVSEDTDNNSYFTRMYSASGKVWDDGKGNTVGYQSLSGVTSAYAEIRKEIESKYTGEELEKHLQMLDADYDRATGSVAEGTINAIRYFAATKQEPAGPLKDIFKKMNVDFNKPTYMDDVDAFVKVLKDSLIRVGELAKQYIRDGNAAPNTVEGKKDFADYLNGSKNSNDNFFSTIDELKDFI